MISPTLIKLYPDIICPIFIICIFLDPHETSP